MNPFMALKVFITNLPIIFIYIIFVRLRKWLYINKVSFTRSIIYTFITVLEIIVLSRIIGFGINEWLDFFKNGFNFIKQLVP